MLITLKKINLINCFLTLIVLSSSDLYAEQLHCQSFAVNSHSNFHDFPQIFDLINLKNVQLACLEEYPGAYDTSYVRGLTQANFETKHIKVFISDVLYKTQFSLVLVHELSHAEQYISWMKGLHLTGGMDEKLNAVHSLVKPQGLNASFQTIAQMKRKPEFKSDAKSWYKSYVNMQFCMEYQAYKNESDSAMSMAIPTAELPEHLNALNKGQHEPLLSLLNATVVKRLFDKLYSTKELNQVHSICGKGETPGEWFSASATALNLL